MSPVSGQDDKYKTGDAAQAAGATDTLPLRSTPVTTITTTLTTSPPSATKATVANILHKHTTITGGDITDCLSNYDIDAALATLLGPHYVDALILRGLRVDPTIRDQVVKTLEQQLLASAAHPRDRWLYAPLHVRHHWCGTIITARPNYTMTVLDSAPSPITRCDIAALARRMQIKAIVHTPVRQASHTNECGLFTVLFGLLAKKNFRLLLTPGQTPGPVISLSKWRQLLQHDPVVQEHTIPALMRDIVLPAHLPQLIQPEPCTAPQPSGPPPHTTTPPPTEPAPPLPLDKEVTKTRRNDPYAVSPTTACRVCHAWPCTCAATTAGATEDVQQARVLRDAPALSHPQIRRCLAAIPSGSTIHVIWRAGTEVHEWYGELAAPTGPARARRWQISYFADSDGPLLADDGITFVREDATLPPTDADVHIIQATRVDMSQGDPAPLATPLPTPTTPQVQPYDYVPDEGYEVDPLLWTAPPAQLPNATFAGTAHITGADFMRFDMLPEAEAKRRATPIVWAAVTTAVRHRHIVDLAAFREYIRSLGATGEPIPLDALLVHHLQLEKQHRRWHWSTLSRHAAGLVGALIALPIYAAHAPTINPTAWPRFRAVLQTAKRMTTAQGQHEPAICTPADVAAAAAAPTTTQQTAALLVLCWFTAQRPCDVLQMKKEHLEFLDNGKIRVRITRGKTVGTQGAHHIHSAVQDPAMMATLRSYHDAAAGPFLFPIGSAYHKTRVMTELREALRAVRPALEARSLRRGTLCCMAAAGATEQELLQWSRHTTVAALRRYLYFERTPHAEHQQMQSLAPHALAVTGGDTPAVSFEDFLEIHGDLPYFSIARAPKPITAPAIARTWPLHVKEQAKRPISIDAVNRLADTAPAEVKAAWREDSKLLSNDDGRYDRIQWDGVIHQASLTADDVERLLQTGQIKEIEPTDFHRIRGSVRIFTKPEPAKMRRRKITWTENFNNTFSKEEVAPDRGNATRDTARLAILASEGALGMDFAAQFDFIPYNDDVTWFECFAVGARLFRSMREAMGKRSSTSCATSLTRVLLAFPVHHSVKVHYATDGVRFAGPRRECVDAAYTFTKRARMVHAVINEIDVETCTRDDVDALWQTDGADFLGDIVDFRAKTIQCRPRHVTRLRDFARDGRRAGATHAEQFRWQAMLLYMRDTLGVPRHAYYATSSYFRGLARQLAIDPTLWSKPCHTRPPGEINHATAICLANAPARIMPAPVIDVVSIVDASAAGYAGIVCRLRADRTWHTTLVQDAWEPAALHAYDMHLSTNSEPEGLVRVARYVHDNVHPRGHLVISDHTAFVDAFQHGSSPSPHYNTRIQRARSLRVDAISYTPGDANPADEYSRFQRTTLTPAHRKSAETLAAAFIGHVMGPPFRIVG